MNDANAVRWRPVARADQLRRIAGVRNDAVGTGHNAIIEPLDGSFFGIGAVIGGDEGDLGGSRRYQRTPGRGSAAGVDQCNTLPLHNRMQSASIPQNAKRVFRCGRKPDQLPASLRDAPLEAAAFRRDESPASGPRDCGGDLDRRQLGAAGIELRYDLQYGRLRIAQRRGSLVMPEDGKGMPPAEPEFMTVGHGADCRRIAMLLAAGRSSMQPGLVWLPGFKSEMTSTKASALAAWAERQGVSMTRLDYSGHGLSEGRVEDGTIGRWLEEVRTVFLDRTRGPQVVVGSSMGGYLALLLLRDLVRTAPEQAPRIQALVLVAPAWDMTERLMWPRMPESARAETPQQGRLAEAVALWRRSVSDHATAHRGGSRAFDWCRGVQSGATCAYSPRSSRP